MRNLGDMWGTGLFKLNACDFYDDVTTELADISLGDAWLKPYDSDGAGNNIIKAPLSIIHEGIDYHSFNHKLNELREISVRHLIDSIEANK